MMIGPDVFRTTTFYEWYDALSGTTTPVGDKTPLARRLTVVKWTATS